MGWFSNLGRQTPPAIFTVIFGLFGLTLAWRAAARTSVVPQEVSEMMLGAVVALFAVAAVPYVIKALRRPAAVIEDLRILPGRGGLAAFSLCFAALSIGLVPLAPIAAQTVLYIALGVHVVLALLVIYVFATGPAEQRRVTPLWHLSFVGFIVSAVAAAALGKYDLAQVIFWVTFAVAVAIWAVSALQLFKGLPPAPLRPLLAIHLAPASLFGIVALGFPVEDFPAIAQMVNLAAVIAMAILLALVFTLKWLMEAGFTPLWGAFTFPLAAFATFFLSLAETSGALLPKIIGVVAIVAATFFIPWVASKVVKLWIKGTLAVKTNASKA